MTTPDVKTWTPHLKASWGGEIGDPVVDIWSNTVNFIDPAALVPSEAQIKAMLPGVAAAVQAWFTSTSSVIGTAAQLGYLKLTWIKADGKQRDINTAVFDYPAGVFGTSNQPPCIWEQTYALTLRTGLTRGRAHVGRIYPPLNGSGPTGKTPYMAEGNANVMASSFAAALVAIQSAINAQLTAGNPSPAPKFQGVVVSPGSANAGTAPMWSRFTGVVVDRVADIQHRRVNRVPRLEGTLAAVAAL